MQAIGSMAIFGAAQTTQGRRVISNAISSQTDKGIGRVNKGEEGRDWTKTWKNSRPGLPAPSHS